MGFREDACLYRRDGGPRGDEWGASPTLRQQFAALFRANDSWFDADLVAVDGSTGKLQSWIDYNDNTHLLTQGAVGNQCVLPSADASLGGAKSAAFVQASANYYDGNRAISAYDYLSDGSGATTYLVLVPGAFVAADYTMATTGNTTQGFDCYRSGSGIYQSRLQGGTNSQAVSITGVVASTATYLELVMKTGSAAGEMRGRLKNGTPSTHAMTSATGAQVVLRVGARPVTAALACNMRMRALYSFHRELSATEIALVQAFIQADTGIVP